jgi:hypothetical protein
MSREASGVPVSFSFFISFIHPTLLTRGQKPASVLFLFLFSPSWFQSAITFLYASTGSYGTEAALLLFKTLHFGTFFELHRCS